MHSATGKRRIQDACHGRRHSCGVMRPFQVAAVHLHLERRFDADRRVVIARIRQQHRVGAAFIVPAGVAQLQR